ELAAARTQLFQAEQAVSVAKANLTQFTGGEPAQVVIVADPVLRPAPERVVTASDTSHNPVLLEQNAAVEQARAQLRVLERSYSPRFYLQGLAYSRGTGADLDGRRLGGLGGLAPTVQDFGGGLTVTFPVSDIVALRAKRAAQSATVRAQS